MPGIPAPSSRHLVRWIALAIAVVLAALLLALAIHVHRLLQPARFTTLLENNLAAAGLKLRLQAPAEPMLFPHPGVQLEGFSLSNAGSDQPVLQAARATIVVPWRALLRGEVAIERVEVIAPRIDLDELEALLARLPHRVGPPRLPTIATGISMTRGTLVRDGKPMLFDFTLATGALAPGRAFGLVASARSDSGKHFNATVATVPATRDGAIDFQALRFDLAEQGGAKLHLEGRGNWRGGERVALQLHGTLAHAALAPAAATTATVPATAQSVAAPANRITTDTVAVAVSPPHGSTPLTFTLKLDGEDAHVDLAMQPTEFGRWWKRVLAAPPGQAPATLPFTGTAKVRELDFGWIKASGLTIEAGPDLAPASATTVASPPPSTSTAR